MANKKCKTIILTPLQVREAIVAYGQINCALAGFDFEIAYVVLNPDGSASIKYEFPTRGG